MTALDMTRNCGLHEEQVKESRITVMVHSVRNAKEYSLSRDVSNSKEGGGEGGCLDQLESLRSRSRARPFGWKGRRSELPTVRLLLLHSVAVFHLVRHLR